MWFRVAVIASVWDCARVRQPHTNTKSAWSQTVSRVISVFPVWLRWLDTHCTRVAILHCSVLLMPLSRACTLQLRGMGKISAPVGNVPCVDQTNDSSCPKGFGERRVGGKSGAEGVLGFFCLPVREQRHGGTELSIDSLALKRSGSGPK